MNPKHFSSKLTHIKDIEQRNKAFDALSDEDKRREIAYDCLKLTLIGKVIGAYNRYWSNSLECINESDSKKFQKLLVHDLPECAVCVRGGMMLSQIRLGNSLTTYSPSYYKGYEGNLKGFNIDSFLKMEFEYESTSYQHPYNTDTTEKLQNICLNVIHNGDFNVDDDTDYVSSCIV